MAPENTPAPGRVDDRRASSAGSPLRALLGLARHVQVSRVEQRPELDLRLLAVSQAQAERRALGPAGVAASLDGE
jgi:hypothetical protein